MPKPTHTPQHTPVNPHWLEFFRRIRQEAQRLDALERDKKGEETQAPRGPH